MADSPARWREPTKLVPLRWGTWAGRSWGGLWLIAAGGAAIAGSNGPTAWLAVLGLAAHLIGWSVLPSRGWRRVVVLAPSAVAMLALLAGPGYLTVLVVPLLCWFLVRHRPLRVWPMAAFVVATGIVIARLVPEYHGMPVAASVAIGVAVGAAWAARAVHAASARARRTSRRRRSIAP
ncbi:MAG: hypothetical protein R2717_00410 [Schumannella sp.]|nr:hypothetical protein [Microbacteriaceae bacterium]